MFFLRPFFVSSPDQVVFLSRVKMATCRPSPSYDTGSDDRKSGPLPLAKVQPKSTFVTCARAKPAYHPKREQISWRFQN
jgi:hypothetical protein